MERFTTYSFNPEIQFALDTIPERFLDFINCDFFVGADPVYAGLITGGEKTFDGRSYRDTACADLVKCQTDRPVSMRKPTVILPKKTHPISIIHELGHILQEQIDPDERITMQPICDYAKHGNDEAFACAFSYYLGEDYFVLDGIYQDIHPRDRAFFQHLFRE